MPDCDLDLMLEFSCDELREKRMRADINIMNDKRKIEDISAAIRRENINISNTEAKINELRSEPPQPSVSAPISTDRDGKPRTPGRFETAIEVIEGVAAPIYNWREIRRLESDIDNAEERVRDLLRDLADRNERYDEMLAGRECIKTAMRRKGCRGA